MHNTGRVSFYIKTVVDFDEEKESELKLREGKQW